MDSRVEFPKDTIRKKTIDVLDRINPIFHTWEYPKNGKRSKDLTFPE